MGLIIGGIIGWLMGIGSAHDEPETTSGDIIEQSLDDSFWSNSTTAATEAETTEPVTTEAETIVVYGTHKYVLNKGTMKIHRADCAFVKDIQSENYAETDDFIGSLVAGYSQCKNCYPSE